MNQRRDQSPPPTVDRIRADISGGRTREKVDSIDPAAAPLGTDDEAAGHAASLQERRMEAEARPPLRLAPPPSRGPIAFYLAFILVLAVALATGAYLLR